MSNLQRPRFRNRSAVWVQFVIAVVLTGIAACGGGTLGSAGSTALPTISTGPSLLPLEACVQSTDHAREIAFAGSDSGRFAAAELGSGTVGIVLAHEYMGDLCGWFPYADHLRDLGWRVLAFDFGSGSLIGGVVGAASQLRREGVTKIVLVGASMGSAAALAAGPRLAPLVVAVAALSSPETFEGVDATAGAKRLTMPVLFLDSLHDTDFTTAAQTMFAECPSPHKELMLLPGNDHGTQLLRHSVATQAQTVLDTFIAKAVA